MRKNANFFLFDFFFQFYDWKITSWSCVRKWLGSHVLTRMTHMPRPVKNNLLLLYHTSHVSLLCSHSPHTLSSSRRLRSIQVCNVLHSPCSLRGYPVLQRRKPNGDFPGQPAANIEYVSYNRSTKMHDALSKRFNVHTWFTSKRFNLVNWIVCFFLCFFSFPKILMLTSTSPL